MARPSRIDAALAAQIDELAAQGHTRLGLTKALAARGVKISRRTVGRYLDEHPAPAVDLGDPAPGWQPPQDPSEESLDELAAKALETDDLKLIARAAEVARRLEEKWGKSADHDPTAARTWATVSRQHAELRTRLHALRPRADVETDRLTELGEPARAALLERLRERAVVDQRLAMKLARARETLQKNGWF